MKRQTCLMKLLQIVRSAGFLLVPLALANPAKAASSVSGTATFSGTVSPSCVVATGFLPSPKSYTQSGTGPSGGKKSLAATVSATFNCNSDTVGIAANITTLTAPQFTNATNLDLKLGGAPVGTIHLVSIAITDGDTLASLQEQNTTGPISLEPDISPTDSNGNIQLAVTSQFNSALGGAEELAAGTYQVVIDVTVTAQ